MWRQQSAGQGACAGSKGPIPTPSQQRERHEVPFLAVNQVTAPRDLFFCSKCSVLMVLF